MGNSSSYIWKHLSKKDGTEDETSPKLTEQSVVQVVEDIQKLSPENIEQQFESIYRTSNEIMHTIAHNPCDQLAKHIRQCLIENNKKMSKCFAVMESYRICVSELMEKKLVDVVTDYENAGAQARLLDGPDAGKTDDNK